METTGQTMGLDETLNGLNATSEENGIDVHMMLPTEYGAIVILSTTGYGNPGKLRDETDAQKRTTTGNSTGVYFTGDRCEWVAASYVLATGKYNDVDQSKCGTLFALPAWHGGVGYGNRNNTPGSGYFRGDAGCRKSGAYTYNQGLFRLD